MSIIQVFQQFPTQESCIEHLEKVRWGKKPKCPYCKSENTTRNDGRHYCYNCKTSFSVTVRTIFHKTHLPLQKWFWAITLILKTKKGISTLQLSRDIEVNKNTAWRIVMKTNEAMKQDENKELLQSIVKNTFNKTILNELEL